MSATVYPDKAAIFLRRYEQCVKCRWPRWMHEDPEAITPVPNGGGEHCKNFGSDSYAFYTLGAGILRIVLDDLGADDQAVKDAFQASKSEVK